MNKKLYYENRLAKIEAKGKWLKSPGVAKKLRRKINKEGENA